MSIGQVRIGRTNDNKTEPSYPNFTPIWITTKNQGGYWQLSPYYLKDKNNRIMENIWQFSKIYQQVPKTIQYVSRWNRKIIWDHPAEIHLNSDGTPNTTYYQWRKKGMAADNPIRYPVGYHHRSKALAAFDDQMEGPYNYIDARKKIYLPIYTSLVKLQPLFFNLKERLTHGENLLLIDVDGPKGTDLPYYQSKYGVNSDFIVNNTIEANIPYMKIMLNDPKNPFGHGYCLAMALLDIETTLLE